MTVFILPVLQIIISWVNYHYNRKWQTVLILQIHLLVSTALGLFLEGYLYLRYISNDAESVIIFQGICKIGSILVFGLGALVTLIKYLSTRKNIK